MTRKIHAAAMTQNELKYLVYNVERMLPYVDTVTLVDGGSSDDTIVYFRNWEKRESKIRFFIHPWEDNFPKQRNNYVKRVAEIAKPGDWVLTFDADEVFEINTLENLHAVADHADALGKNMIGFRCRSVSERGGQRCWENLDEYWKELFIKWDPNFHYTGYKCHEGKGGIPHNIMRVNLIYEHVKEENVIWKRGCRNSFVAGGGDNVGESNPIWVKVLKFLQEELGIVSWAEFDKYLTQGNIHPALRKMIIDFRLEGTPEGTTENNWKSEPWNGSSEWKEWYKYYFRMLHPEEEPEELRSIHIP